MEDELQQFFVVEEGPNCLVLQRDNSIYLYKEFTVPRNIGYTILDDPNYVVAEFERRKAIVGDGVLTIEKIVCTQQEDEEPRIGILFESYLKNFDEELQIRHGTDNYWPEDQLFNTFQACLQGLKTFHDNQYIHGAIGPQSIIFSQDCVVKLADYFVVADDLRKNWSATIDYGQWPPEVIADWSLDQGWLQSYETMEADLWALGLVFLESMILEPSYEVYFSSETKSININSSILARKLQTAAQLYSPVLMGLLDILLSPDPRERNWDKILDYNNQLAEPKSEIKQRESVEMIANSLGQVRQYIAEPPQSQEDVLPVFRNSSNQSMSCVSDDLTTQTRNQLTKMLETCLQKTKDLVSESRKKQAPSYFTLNNLHPDAPPLTQSKTSNEESNLDELIQQSMQRSRQVIENSLRKTTKSNNNSMHHVETNESRKENLDMPVKHSSQKISRYEVPKTAFANIDYENSITYSGIVQQGPQECVKSGYGVLFNKDSADVLYQGDWKVDNFHGKGFLKNFALEPSAGDCDPHDFSNLSHIWRHYQGEFQEGLMNGKGQLTLADGSVFQGTFVQGVIEGFGMYLKEGQVLIGQWSQNHLTNLLSSTF